MVKSLTLAIGACMYKIKLKAMDTGKLINKIFFKIGENGALNHEDDNDGSRYVKIGHLVGNVFIKDVFVTQDMVLYATMQDVKNGEYSDPSTVPFSEFNVEETIFIYGFLCAQ